MRSSTPKLKVNKKAANLEGIAPLIIGESVMEVKPHNVKLEEDEGGGGNAQFLFLV